MGIRPIPSAVTAIGGGRGGVRVSGVSDYAALNRLIFGSSLIGQWMAAEPSGNTALDSSGAGRNGAYVGAHTLGVAGIGDGRTSVTLAANGILDIYSASLAGVFNMDQGYLGVWCAADDAALYSGGGTGTYLAKLAITAGSGVGDLRMYSAYLWGFLRRCTGAPTIIFETPTTTRFVHIGYAWDVTAGTMQVYVNGLPWRAKTGALSTVGALGSAFACIGASTNTPATNGTFPGRIAHVVLTNATPTAAQVWRSVGASGTVVFEGDSRTINKLWSAAAVEGAIPGGDLAFGKRGYVIQATAGATNALITGRAAETDALLRGYQDTLVVWYGVNDSGSSTAAQIYANIAAYCTARRAAGWEKIVVCTEIDAQGAVKAQWHDDDTWTDLNTLLRAGYAGFANALIDLGGDARLQDATDTTYYNADELHLVAAGYAVVAELATPVLAAIL
jgi:lysophospholipase L1-like esterase